MKITVEARGSWEDVKNVARNTVHKDPTVGEPSEQFKWDIADGEHSPLRARWYLVRMEGIPTFVSVHLVRHKVGVEHFVSSNREDRGGDANADRMTPVNHVMLINAAALQAISRRRLCILAHEKTRIVWFQVVQAVRAVDPEVADTCLPMCLYRGGYCHEAHGCGRFGRLPQMRMSELLDFFRERDRKAVQE